MKKRVIALLLAGSMCLSVIGCGKKEDDKKDDKKYSMEVKSDDEVVEDSKVPKDNVKLGKYKGLEVTMAKVEVTDDELQQRLESSFASKITYSEVTDRAVQDGDVVNLDYAGTIDGEAFDGGSQEGADLEIGSGQFIDGFEEQLVGHSIGEEFDITVPFPENYQSSELAGKDAVFAVKINSIKTEDELVINDELVNEISEGTTLKEYKEELKETMLKEKKSSAESEKISNAWSQVIEDSKVKKLPLSMVQESAELFYTSYEQYKESYGMSDEEFEEQILSMAKDNVRSRLVAKAIAEKENIKVSDKDYEAKLKEMASNSEDEDTKAIEKQYGKEYIQDVMLMTEVSEFVAENAKEVEAKAETDAEK